MAEDLSSFVPDAPDLSSFVPDKPVAAPISGIAPADSNIGKYIAKANATPDSTDWEAIGKFAVMHPVKFAQGLAHVTAATAQQTPASTVAVNKPFLKQIAAQAVDVGSTAAGATAGGFVGGLPGAAVGATAGNYAGQRINDATGLQPMAPPLAAAGQAIGAGITGMARGPITAPLAAATGLTAQSLMSGQGFPSATQYGLAAAGGVAGSGSPVTADYIQESEAAAARNAMKEGIAIDPNMVNSSFPNRVLGSAAGKADMKVAASEMNAPKINDLGVRAMGLPSGTELNQQAIDLAKTAAQQPYDAIRAISTTADTMMDDLQDLKYNRDSLQAQYDGKIPGSTSLRGNPAIQRQLPNANLAVDNQVAQIKALATKATGNSNLADAFDAANTRLAKIGEVENAFDPNTNILSAKTLAQRAKRNPNLYTDELKTIADTGTYFPDYVKDPAGLAKPGASKLNPAVAFMAAKEGFGAAGPLGLAAGVLPFMDKPARGAILSPTWQQYMGQPAFGYNDPNMAQNLMRYAGTTGQAQLTGN